MRKIQDLTVKTTYRAGFGSLEVTESIYNGLCKIRDNYGFGISADEANMAKDNEILDAYEWLTDNINESNAMWWEYEIEELEE